MKRRLIAALILSALLSSTATAERLSSPSYRIDESLFGSGGSSTTQSSPSYSAQSSVGATGIGPTTGNDSQASGGYTTAGDPALSFSVTSAAVNFGALSTGAAATGTASFTVTNYTTYGYIVKIIGNPPTNGSHNLSALASPAASSIGSEQFGINLAANTAPTTFGAAPSGGQGAAAASYAAANSFTYVNGATIASASRNSAQTTYTISYLANIATTTPGGSYNTNQTLVCVGTY